MLRRIIGIILILLGLAAIIFGVGRLTWWEPSERVGHKINVSSIDGAPLVVLDPSVKNSLEKPEVIVKYDGNYSVSQGAPEDTESWLDNARRATVTSINPDTGQMSAKVTGDGEAPDPRGADIWRQTSGENGESTISWSLDNPDDKVVIATDGKQPAPTDIEIVSKREKDWFLPLLAIALGLLALIAGLVLALMRRKKGQDDPYEDYYDDEFDGEDSLNAAAYDDMPYDDYYEQFQDLSPQELENYDYHPETQALDPIGVDTGGHTPDTANIDLVHADGSGPAFEQNADIIQAPPLNTSVNQIRDMPPHNVLSDTNIDLTAPHTNLGDTQYIDPNNPPR